MKTRGLGLTSLLLCAGLAVGACDLAPERAPDTTLALLAQASLADSVALADTRPDLAAIADRQARALLEEAARLCGTDSQGQPIRSCVPSIAPDEVIARQAESVEGSPQEIMAQAATRLADSAPALDPSSVPLVSKLLVEDAVLGDASPQLPESIDAQDPRDVQLMKDMLAWEYSAEFGLQVAQAYAEPGLREQIAHAVDHHRDQIDAVRGVLLTAPGMTQVEMPVAAAGYEFSNYPTPVDSGTALTVAEAVESDGVRTWYAQAAQASTPGWRRFAMIAAAHAALDANPFVDARGTRPWEAEYLSYPAPPELSQLPLERTTEQSGQAQNN